MLDNLRKHASSWLAKILIALLIVSFAVWGIADQITGGGERVLARIDGQEITLEQFRNSYQDQITALSRQRGQPISAQEARDAGLPDQVLQQLVNAALLDAHARRLGLSVDDETVSRSIIDSPFFQDDEGNFSRALFEQALRFSNLSEGAVLAQERSALIRDQMLGTVGQTAAVPGTLVNAMHRYRGERRVISHFTIGPGAVEAPGAPGEAELRSFYDDNSQDFLAPETREVAVIDLTPGALTERVDVTEDQVRADYEARRDQYDRAERREIRQIVFPDMAAARAGYEALQGGEAFLDVAKRHGMSEADTQLGAFAKSQIADPRIAEAAFALDQGAISEPIQGAFTTVILRVDNVEPGTTRAFEEVREEIKAQLSERAAAERIMSLAGTIEDERAAGAPLSEVAATLELPFQTLTLDSDGKTPEGLDAPAPAQLAQFRSAVFASRAGADEDPIERPDGGLIWYEVLTINPASARPFDTARDDVEAAWRAARLRDAIKQKADDLAAQAQAGKSLAELAESIGATLMRSEPAGRGAAVDGLSSSAVGRAFTMAQGDVATASAPEPPAQTVFQLSEIVEPDEPPEAEAEQMRRAVRNAIENDVREQYIAALRGNFDHTVNREVLRQTLGL